MLVEQHNEEQDGTLHLFNSRHLRTYGRAKLDLRFEQLEDTLLLTYLLLPAPARTYLYFASTTT